MIGLELAPVGALASALIDQLAKTALAAQDIRYERSFKKLGDYLNAIQTLFLRLNVYKLENSPALLLALQALKEEVSKTEEIVTKYRSRSVFSNILQCRSICENLQKSMRDIGKSLQLLELGNIEVSDAISSAILQLESDMLHTEVSVSSDHMRILDLLKSANDRDGTDRSLIISALEKIASAVGLSHDSCYISAELLKFRKDIKEAKERKEQQEVQYMEQILSVLSREDTVLALENSQKEYRKLKEGVRSQPVDFPVNQPPHQYICHLTRELMHDPVILCSGHSYERTAIETRFKDGNFTDPLSGQHLRDSDLKPNIKLAMAIKTWKQQNSVARILKCQNMLYRNTDTDREAALSDLLKLCEEFDDCKNWLVFEGFISHILDAAKARNVRHRVGCFTLLQILVKDRDHAKEKLFQSGGLSQIVRSLRKGVDSLERVAISLLLELLKDRNDVLSLLHNEQGAILFLVTTLLSGNQDDNLREGIERILDQLSEDEDCLKEMAYTNWFKPLICHLSNAGPKDSKLKGAAVLAQLELTDKRREALVDANVIKPLVNLLKTADMESKLASLRALHNVLASEKAKTQFAELGAVPWVVDSVKKSPQLLRESAVAILAELTTNTGSGLLFYETGNPIHVGEIVNTLADIVSSSQGPILITNSVKVLQNLVMSDVENDTCKMICFPESRIKIYSRLVKTRSPPLSDAVIYLLFCLFSKSTEIASSLRGDHEFFRKLLDLIKNTRADLSTRSASAGILSHFSLSSYQNLIAIGDIFPALVKMLSETGCSVQENALCLLANITDSEVVNFQRSLIELEIIEYLKVVLRRGTTVAKIKACNILRNFSKNTPKLCTQRKSSFKLSRKSSMSCKLHSAKCNLKDTFCISEAGIVPDVVEILRDGNAPLALAAMEVLETFLVENNFHNGVEMLDEFNAIEQLFPLFQLDFDHCSEKCIQILEIIFKALDKRRKYGQRVQKLLTRFYSSSNLSLKQKAIKFSMQLADT